jgi:probable rRNA maturation factor
VTGTISFHNRQRKRRLNTPSLRRRFEQFLNEWPTAHQTYDIGVYFVSETESARLNQEWLQHEGPTDVITFDYNARPDSSRKLRKGSRGSTVHETSLNGEIFICVEEAVRQAREFKTSWQEELVRYVIHGILHLCGFDDLKPNLRREMKRQENQLVRRWNRLSTLRAA